MNNNTEKLKLKIIKLQNKLHELLKNEYILSNNVLHVSRELDKLIVEYHKIDGEK
ncbi:MAG: Spo0E like sporulation regulatory protein [Petroclostridium sp.]|jgi:hypothetical protein|uniref:aspartyl-phosphate phosphatase Spo0E family protein n=1 Tax=Petroclostridium xylanilyticum TaxID=1792311 RepID=UPI000E3D2723|nr:aspartyl-phosphate phosphatase Spo0E family protein [Petroclostridium xylanilyticum]MBZ4647526.1 Spo0E like sporulation regulatory protein [Clostridia bacterium]MDK2811649.1 Spo0E like sporulation regulatory protein [Petroclostridium sp.]